MSEGETNQKIKEYSYVRNGKTITVKRKWSKQPNEKSDSLNSWFEKKGESLKDYKNIAAAHKAFLEDNQNVGVSYTAFYKRYTKKYGKKKADKVKELREEESKPELRENEIEGTEEETEEESKKEETEGATRTRTESKPEEETEEEK